MRFLALIIARVTKSIYKKKYNEFKNLLNSTYLLYKHSQKDLINSNLINILILAEDCRFYSHGGIDFVSVLRAFISNLYKPYLQGASTIEQQLVRTITGNREITYKRKINEMLQASWIIDTVPKKEIPEVYLSVAYFGEGINNIKDLCCVLNINFENISEFDSIKIITRLKYPQPKDNNPSQLAKINKREAYLWGKYCQLK